MTDQPESSPWNIIIPMLVLAFGIGAAVGQYFQTPAEAQMLPTNGTVTLKGGQWHYWVCAGPDFVGAAPKVWTDGDTIWYDQTGVRWPE